MGEQRATVDLEEVDGRTRMTMTILMPSREARERDDRGLGLGYERPDALLEGSTAG